MRLKALLSLLVAVFISGCGEVNNISHTKFYKDAYDKCMSHDTPVYNYRTISSDKLKKYCDCESSYMAEKLKQSMGNEAMSMTFNDIYQRNKPLLDSVFTNSQQRCANELDIRLLKKSQ